jgi:prevent-host-death family protein
MEKTLPVSEAKMKLNRLIERVIEREDEFVITKNGSPAAALIPADLYESWKETRAIKADAELVRQIKRGVQRLRRGGKRYSFEEVFGET